MFLVLIIEMSIVFSQYYLSIWCAKEFRTQGIQTPLTTQGKHEKLKLWYILGVC